MAQLRASRDEHLQQQQEEEALHGVSAVPGVGGNDESSISNNNKKKKARAGLCGVLRERKVVDLAARGNAKQQHRRLVEVPYTATLAHTANALLAARVSAVAVAAPPGHWIGAGGSTILQSDPATGAVRKHYIGMLNVFDVLAHIADADADADDNDDLDRRLAVPVSSVIGHSLEGLTLWTLHPSTSVLDCMETFSKGVHRALVPLESTSSSEEKVVAAELVESSAPGYGMVTQMDVARFLRAHGAEAELRDVLSRTVRDLSAVNDNVFAVAASTTVIDAVRAMRAASLTAVPVVDVASDAVLGSETLIYGNGQRAIETFSATDLRDCPVARLQPWLGISVTEFKKKVAEYRATNKPAVVPGADDATDTGTPTDDERQGEEAAAGLVTCSAESTLGEAIEAAVARHVHRLWVVDEDDGLLLRGVVSLTDMLRAVREAALGEDREMNSIVS